DLLKQLEVPDQAVEVARELGATFWMQHEHHRDQSAALIASRCSEIEEQIEQLSRRAGTTISDTVFKSLEAEIERLVRERQRLDETEAHANKQQMDFGTAFEKVRTMLKSPYETWISGDVHRRRTLTRVLFPKPLVYTTSKGL